VAHGSVSDRTFPFLIDLHQHALMLDNGKLLSRSIVQLRLSTSNKVYDDDDDDDDDDAICDRWTL